MGTIYCLVAVIPGFHAWLKQKSSLRFCFFFNDLKYLGSRLALVNLYSIKCLELTTTKPSSSAFLLCVAYCTAVAQSCSACQSDSETHPINLKLGSEMFQNDTCFINFMQQ